MATSLNNLGGVALNGGDYRAACAPLEVSLALHCTIANKRGATLALNNLGEHNMAAVKAALHPAQFSATWSDGQAMILEQAVTHTIAWYESPKSED